MNGIGCASSSISMRSTTLISRMFGGSGRAAASYIAGSRQGLRYLFAELAKSNPAHV